MNNSAARLYAILREAKRQPESEPAFIVWSNVLKIVDRSPAEVFMQLARLNQQLDRVIAEIKALPLNHERYLRLMGNVRKALTRKNLDEQWILASKMLDEETLTRLEFCENELAKASSEREMPGDELERLSKEIEALVAALLNEELPLPLKALLIDLAESMRHALQQYRIRGIQGLREAFAIVRERVLQNSPMLVTELEKPSVKKFVEVVNDWNTATAACIEAGKYLISGSQFLLQWFKN